VRILVVDDEYFNRFLLLNMLQEEGYAEVFEAESGEQALELAAEIKPDIVLLDIIMPNLSGFEVAPKLKQMAGDVYLPIIFITALDDQESMSKGLTYGGDDFVLKPFNKLILAAKIRAHARTRVLSIRAQKQNQALIYHQNLIDREHSIVEHIFSNALRLDPDYKSIVDFHLAPASNFNGDMLLLEKGPAGSLYILLGDFTGHGLASAIGALPVAKAFQAMADKGLSISEMAETFNLTLLDLLPDDMFFATALVEISKGGRTFSVWNGGIPHLILLNEDGELIRRFESKHMALGILDNEDFESHVERYEAEHGARLFGYTDGVIESENEQGEMLQEEGLEAWLLQSANIGVQALTDKLQAFRGNAEQADDITLFCFTFKTLEFKGHEAELPCIPWKIEFDCDVEQIRRGGPINDLMDMLSIYKGLAGRRAAIFTVVSELFNNALDHGLLELESELKEGSEGFVHYYMEKERRFEALDQGSIQISLEYKPKQAALKLSMKDSGKGFDINNVFSQVESNKGFGRGLALIQELSSSVSYSDGGTKAEVIFDLSQ